ncbi:hypothetical protein BKA65DRAFT_568848 [Rhexocercosporidium sp. MPI-PUGE-AT-0058]|nr:hypothetical protein BKA65DRAFT_568848 [Rhexocercosporidium sp. MPI-PUGE-AT-0058]
MPDLFTTHTGEAFPLEIPPACERHNSISACDYPTGLDGTSLPIRGIGTQNLTTPDLDSSFDIHDPSAPSLADNDTLGPVTSRRTSCGSTNPLIEIVDPDDLPKTHDISPEPTPSNSATKSPAPQPWSKTPGRRRSSIKDVASLVTVKMVYNEYGELVEEKDLTVKQKSDELSVKQLLRVIKKAYHHELRDKLGKIITPRADGKATVLVDDGIWTGRLSSWDFRGPRSPKSVKEKDDIPMETHLVAVYHGPPRVLELGCSDGSWCFNFKREQPDWIVEGVDDTNHWSCIPRDLVLRDFMSPNTQPDPYDYFSVVHTSQDAPEFAMRNLNCLLAHQSPIPHNLYEFIRAREIFDRVESYKTFLDDVRSLLKPDGVVEFLEIDPRPRVFSVISKTKKEDEKHKSVPQTDWTDNIADRFKNPLDQELATTVPGWSGRVSERLKANMRPQDGVAAACLKSWLQGAGFWDVKQIVLPIPVGGNTRSGQLLKEFVIYELELENCIPKLCDELPKVEISEIESGAYFMNLHIVTGRKPYDPRPGDLLRDGSRQEMTASKYDAMARHHDSKTSQWKRFDLQGKLTTMMQSLSSLTAPNNLNRTGGDADHFALRSRRVDVSLSGRQMEGTLIQSRERVHSMLRLSLLPSQ